MKSIQIKEFARKYEFDDVISLSDHVEKPKRKPGTVLIRVIACSLAPGDCRVASGHTELIQGPKKFPYIPGGDISGIIAEVDESKSRFQVGEAVIAIFKSPRPLDGLAEYIVVDEERVEKFNSAKVDFVDASCLPSSALAALNVVVSNVMPNDRVMVLGGSGGVGPFLVQLCKVAGANFVACTSTQQVMMEELGVDRVIDYTTFNWWELEEFHSDPVDVVFDCVGGPTGWKAIRHSKALKRSSDNGRFIALTFDDPLMEVHNYWQLLSFVSKIAGRAFWNCIVQRSIPYYRLTPDALKVSLTSFKTLIDHVESKRLKVVIDHKGPFEFTQTGVTEAFKLQASRHAHGKVVVRVASNLHEI